MNLNDESFPADELFDQLNQSRRLSTGSSRHFQRQLNESAAPGGVIKLECTSPPFLHSDDCSEEHSFTTEANTSGKTCASDPVGLEEAQEDDDEVNDGHTNPLGSTHSRKAVSYQDIHSTYTKQRFKHVVSKVSQYIAATQAQEKHRMFQRHRSMPETLTPNSQPHPRDAHHSAEELHQLHESSTHTANSSEGDPQTSSSDRDDSYETLLSDRERLRRDSERIQCYSEYLQSKLDDKIGEVLLLKRKSESLRMELADCKDKLKRQSSAHNSLHSLHSLIYCPTSFAKATQTEPQLEMEMEMTMAMEQAQVTPNLQLNGNLNYDSSALSAGSIELALLSVGPNSVIAAAATNKKSIATIQPLSLNFSNDSAEINANGNAELSNGNSQPNRIATNNSGSSQPSSNDSAIEVEEVESVPLPLPARRYGRRHVEDAFRPPPPPMPMPMQLEDRRERIYYYDKRSNRVIELAKLLPMDVAADISHSHSTTQLISGDTTLQLVPRKKRSLRTRMLQFFGPCARCDDQSLDGSMATYTAIPLLDQSQSSYSCGRANMR